MSMFDDLETEEVEEFLEEEPVDEEDIKLAELGMKVEIADRYRKHFTMEILDAKGKPTLEFFQYYLNTQTQEGFDLIKKIRLTKKLKEIFSNTEPVSEDLGKEDLKGLGEYIEKNAQLIQQNKELQDALNEAIAGQTRIVGNLIFLYRLMGKMEFPKGVELTDDDIDVITGIKEAIGE